MEKGKSMSEVVREMTFDEEYAVLLKEKEELFLSEKEDCETPFANCVVRRALRCIRKLQKEIENQKYRVVEQLEELETDMYINGDNSNFTSRAIEIVKQLN